MKNILISTIRLGLIVSTLFFATTGDVFAAPTITPASIMLVSQTSARFSAEARAPQFESVTAWFEWGSTPNLGFNTPSRRMFEGGSFEMDVKNLDPDTTYYFRAVATEGGVTVYSMTSSFKTKGAPVVAAPVSVVNTTPPTGNTPQVNTTKPVVVSTKTVVSNAAPVVEKVSPAVNQNSAAAIGIASVLPGTLIGWVALLIAIFIALLIVLMILESGENRKKQLEPVRVEEDNEAIR